MRSKAGFILGLIGGLGGLVVGWYSMVILGLIGAFAGETATFSVVLTTRILPWVYIICGGLALVGGCFCLKYARIAGIVLMAISGVMLLLPLCLLIFAGLNGASPLIYIILCLPILFVFLGGLKAFKTKIKEAV